MGPSLSRFTGEGRSAPSAHTCPSPAQRAREGPRAIALGGVSVSRKALARHRCRLLTSAHHDDRSPANHLIGRRNRMQQRARTIVGLVGATLAPQFIVFAASIRHGLIGEMRQLAWYTLLASCGMMVLCVLPVHLILQRRGRTKLGDYVWTCITAALLFGVLTGIFFEVVFGWYIPASSVPLFFGFLAALVMVPMSLLFWFIARPNLNPPRAP